MSKKNEERNNPLLKKLDKWIGCPLVFTLGLFHRNHSVSNKYKKIAVIKTAAIGDTVILSAVLSEIKHIHPESEITVICGKSNVAMLKIIPNLNHIEVFAMGTPIKSLLNMKKLGYFDLVLDFGPWPRINALIAWTLKAGYKVGFRRKNTYRHYIYDAKVEHSDEVHEIENYRNILRRAGIEPHGIMPDLRNDVIVREQDEQYVVFHMLPGGSRSEQKRWPHSYWCELAKRVNQEYGLKILFSGSENDKTYIDGLLGELKEIDTENIAGVYSLAEMAGVLENARFVVSVDTGIMHYAAAVGAKLIALHGPTSPLRWGPLSSNAVTMNNNSCQPCLSLGFEHKCENNVCMQDITVEMVMKKIKVIME